MIIRIVLVMSLFYLLIWFLGQRTTTRGQAWGKLLVLLLLVAGVVVVIFPDATNSIAHTVGVGRGADLLLYLLTVSFIGSMLMEYLHHQDEQLKLIRLARRIAIMEANEKDHNKQILKRAPSDKTNPRHNH